MPRGDGSWPTLIAAGDGGDLGAGETGERLPT
jgi:hypothetical protein